MNKILRQGDVLLVPVKSLPAGCTEIPPENGRIVLMHGEVTGHAHAIYDHEASGETTPDKVGMDRAGKIAGLILKNAAAKAKARLLRAPDGSRFLEVTAPVSLKHEEHTAHQIPVGFYELPQQMEHSAERMRRVAD